MATNGTENFQGEASLKTGSLILDQPVVLGCLLGITFLAWLDLLSIALDVSDMAPMVMPGLLITASMWIVMMAAMMLPTAIPMILVFADDPRDRASLATPAFVLGYVLVWTGYALAAVAVHWMLMRHGLFQPGIKVASHVVSGSIFVAAGIYEWSPLKQRCLAKCRAPREFIASHSGPGAIGVLRMGLRHGLYCLGSYWALMLLLFAVGALNLIWVAALSLLVLLQKFLPRGEWIARASGLVMLAAGIYLIVA